MHALKYIIEHDGKTAAELSLDWGISRAAVSQLMKKLGDKGLVQRRPYPGSRRKMLYLPTEAGLAPEPRHTQYDTRVFGETLALLAGAARRRTSSAASVCWNSTFRRAASTTTPRSNNPAGLPRPRPNSNEAANTSPASGVPA